MSGAFAEFCKTAIDTRATIGALREMAKGGYNLKRTNIQDVGKIRFPKTAKRGKRKIVISRGAGRALTGSPRATLFHEIGHGVDTPTSRAAMKKYGPNQVEYEFGKKSKFRMKSPTYNALVAERTASIYGEANIKHFSPKIKPELVSKYRKEMESNYSTYREHFMAPGAPIKSIRKGSRVLPQLEEKMKGASVQEINKQLVRILKADKKTGRAYRKFRSQTSRSKDFSPVIRPIFKGIPLKETFK